jgi:hypothetical protein
MGGGFLICILGRAPDRLMCERWLTDSRRLEVATAHLGTQEWQRRSGWLGPCPLPISLPMLDDTIRLSYVTALLIRSTV